MWKLGISGTYSTTYSEIFLVFQDYPWNKFHVHKIGRVVRPRPPPTFPCIFTSWFIGHALECGRSDQTPPQSLSLPHFRCSGSNESSTSPISMGPGYLVPLDYNCSCGSSHQSHRIVAWRGRGRQPGATAQCRGLAYITGDSWLSVDSCTSHERVCGGTVHTQCSSCANRSLFLAPQQTPSQWEMARCTLFPRGAHVILSKKSTTFSSSTSTLRGFYKPFLADMSGVFTLHFECALCHKKAAYRSLHSDNCGVPSDTFSSVLGLPWLEASSLTALWLRWFEETGSMRDRKTNTTVK